MSSPSVLLYLFAVLLLQHYPILINATPIQGCLLDSSICGVGEICLKDGLFGQCYSDVDVSSVVPTILTDDLTSSQKELLRLELESLSEEGLDWRDARFQCVLTYFKLSVAYNLNYDTEFCSVRQPANIIGLIHRIQSYLIGKKQLEAGLEFEPEIIEVPSIGFEEPSENVAVLVDLPTDLDNNAIIGNDKNRDAIPVILLNDEALTSLDPQKEFVQPSKTAIVVDDEGVLDVPVKDLVAKPESNEQQLPHLVIDAVAELTEASMSNDDDNTTKTDKEKAKKNPKDKQTDLSKLEDFKLTDEDEKQLKQYVSDILNDKKSTIHTLSAQQLEKLIQFIRSLETSLKNTELKVPKEQEIINVEQEEIVPLTSVNNKKQLLLKKDSEKFNNDDMGLSNIEHKIVKGNLQRVEGNRVYLKVGKEKLTEYDLYNLITYLVQKIAEPNNLYFTDFEFKNGQLSFRISRLEDSSIRHKNEKRVDSASRVAQAVYKRRKDIQTLSGVEVDETGVGSGIEVVPVERSERDWMFLPIIMICAFTITSFIIVLTVHIMKNRRGLYKSDFPEVGDHLDGKPSAAYEELCRQRINSQDMTGSVNAGKSSSTSSWPDESLLQSCNLDISTGHVILSFLQEYLDEPDKIIDQWNSVADYTNPNGETTIGCREENKFKNVNPKILPYDDTIVPLKVNGEEKYVNASKIHDSDLRQVAYVATQAPLESTVNDFWNCVWQQGITLIVNLCDQNDARQHHRYWPGEGAKNYGTFEIHLVSEHIWSEDYVVRSFYLKNTETNETRTVTQFHYLSWSENSVPSSPKSLLEFRRKVNKSYRGRASPVLVHCLSGSDRTGTYCLMDIVVNRITKGAGIKELNIAGSLEHIRDQRPCLVANAEQYKFVFSCVAEEVNALLKTLQK